MSRRLAAPVGLFLLVGILWEMVYRLGWVSPYLVASPLQVWDALTDGTGELFVAMAWTGAAALVGFLLSTFFGLFVALALTSSTWAHLAFYPYAVLFQTVPIIAIAPLLVIWLGYGFPTVAASAFLASVFPVIMSALTGFHSTSPELRDLFRLYGSSRWNTFFKLILPMAVPHILTGARIAAGLAVIGAIVGEFVGGGGLGGVIDAARTQQRIDKVFGAVFLASGLGAAVIACIDGLNRLLLSRWSPSGSANPYKETV